MYIPFNRELDDAFRSDRSIWIKLGGCAVVGALTGAYSVTQPGQQDLSLIQIGIVIFVTTVIGAFVGLCLSLKDVVNRRIANGKRVTLVLRAYFAWGTASLLLWFVTIFVVTFAATMLTAGG